MRLTRLFLLIPPLLLTACSSFSPQIKDGPPAYAVDLSKVKKAVPRHLPRSRYGNPRTYAALGKRYRVLPTSKGYNQKGIASWYGTKFNGELTSSREPYNMLAMTAASPVLPIPCFVRVTNLENGRSVIVKVNDRGPFAPNRIIDLSYAAAMKLGYAHKGTALVDVKAINIDQYWAKRGKTHLAQAKPMQHPKLFLQLGAFEHKHNALALEGQVRHYVNKPVEIIPSRHRSGTLYKVRVGPLKGVGESDKVYLKLKHHGLGKAITVIG